MNHEKIFSELIELFSERSIKNKINEILIKFEELFKIEPQDDIVFYFIANYYKFKDDFFNLLSNDQKAKLFNQINNLEIKEEIFLSYKSELKCLYQIDDHIIPIRNSINENLQIEKTIHSTETIIKTDFPNSISNDRQGNQSINHQEVNNQKTIVEDSKSISLSKGTVLEKPSKKIKKKLEEKISDFNKFTDKNWKDYLIENKDSEFFNIGIFNDHQLKENISELGKLEEDLIMKFINLYLRISFIMYGKKILLVKKVFSNYLKEKISNDELIELVLSTVLSIDAHSKYILEGKGELKINENKIEENYKLYCYDKLYNFLDENQREFLIFIIYLFTKKAEKNQKLINSLVFFNIFFKGEKIDSKELDLISIKENKLYIGNMDLLDLEKKHLQNKLLTELEEKRCQEYMCHLKKHFNLKDENIYKLSKEKNLLYIEDYLALLIFYKKLAVTPQTIKDNLIKLEKELISRFKKDKKDNTDSIFKKCNNKIYKEYHINLKEQINKEIKKEISGEVSLKNIKYYLIPFGSIVQFLGKIDSDLDLCLIIESDQLSLIKKFWTKVDNIIFHKFDKNKEIIISQRLFTIKFEYKKMKVDLNYFGLCGMMNSTLIRYYSIIDTRFSILAYNIKNLVKELEIANNENSKEYLNSYSWMLLLITFLQDYNHIPVLPKLMGNQFNKVNIKIFNFENKNKKQNNIKQFEKILDNNLLRDEEYELYEFPIEFENHYKNFKEIHNNKQTVAELFVKFIEFVAYIFKYDSLYINSKKQCIEEKNMIVHKNLLKEENNRQKNFIFISDPFDHTYNPAKDLRNKNSGNKFFDTLRKLLKNMLENGSLSLKV